jgi:hypothetical protein
LMLLVHLKLQHLRYTEMEIIAMGGRREETDKALTSLMERYSSQLFPGADKPKDSFEESARKHLAEEAKKVYLMTPLKGQKRRGSLEKAAVSKNPAIRKWAGDELAKEKQAQHRLQRRLRRVSTKLPEGVVPEKR